MEQQKENWIRTLLSFAGPSKGKMILSVFCAILSVGGGFVPFWAVYEILILFIDQTVTLRDIQFWCLVGVAGYLVRVVCFGVSTILAHISAYTILEGLRLKIADRLMRAPLGEVMGRGIGYLKNIIMDKVDDIEPPLAHMIPELTSNLLLPLAIFAGMLVIDWRLGLSVLIAPILSMIPMAFLMAAGTTLGKYLMKKWEERQAAFSELSDFAQENYSGLAVIKAFVKETKELMMFRRLNRENEDINVEYTKISTLLNIMVTLFVESVICVILGYGGYLVYCGSFDAGQLVEYIGYFSAVVWPIMAVSMLIEKTSRGKASLNRITELLDAKVDVKDRGGVQDLPSIHGKIEFRNLTFRYPDGEYDVLKNVSFTIEPGESVGIVGKTGSGKTTIVDLLLRTYNVPDGTLFIDDHDVNTVSIHSVREGCAYVPQDNFLFSDTISGNISFAFDDENQEAIEDAAMMSDVHDNIAEFKEGYRTVLGERGVTVSGGQKQRISIARALMKHAPILILDDSVSAVDTKTERTILDNLKKREGLTTILIAHRISTVEQMDKIVFVEDGEVHAVGKHEDLYRTCTAYRKMVDLQKLEEEAGEE